MRTIDRSSPIPIYHQIKQILIEELQTNQHEPGKPFLTEDELVQRFRVSRAPVRQALKELVDEGYVYRERSKGTFPVTGHISNASGQLGGLVQHIRKQGFDPQSRVYDVGRIDPPEPVRLLLDLDPGDTVFAMTRIVLLEDLPLVCVRTYLDLSEDIQPTAADLEAEDSIIALLEREYGHAFSRGEQQIWATAANDSDADVLQVADGDPILVTETTIYTRDGLVIGWSRAVHRADLYKYSFVVTR